MAEPNEIYSQAIKAAMIAIVMTESTLGKRLSKEDVLDIGENIQLLLATGHYPVDYEKECLDTEALLGPPKEPEVETEETLYAKGLIILKNIAYLVVATSLNREVSMTERNVTKGRNVDVPSYALPIYQELADWLCGMRRDIIVSIAKDYHDLLGKAKRIKAQRRDSLIYLMSDVMRYSPNPGISDYGQTHYARINTQYNFKDNTLYCKRLIWAVVALKRGIIPRDNFIDNDNPPITLPSERLEHELFAAALVPSCSPIDLRRRILDNMPRLRGMDWFGIGKVGMMALISEILVWEV